MSLKEPMASTAAVCTLASLSASAARRASSAAAQGAAISESRAAAPPPGAGRFGDRPSLKIIASDLMADSRFPASSSERCAMSAGAASSTRSSPAAWMILRVAAGEGCALASWAMVFRASSPPMFTTAPIATSRKAISGSPSAISQKSFIACASFCTPSASMIWRRTTGSASAPNRARKVEKARTTACASESGGAAGAGAFTAASPSSLVETAFACPEAAFPPQEAAFPP